MVAMRWSDRLMGLVSTLILARLLTPADFGLVAMTMLVVGLIDVLLDLGVGAALIQNKHATREDFDTGWTLRLCQALLAAVVIFASASYVAAYFGDPRVTDVMRVVGLSIAVGGLENIGVIRFQKDMEFGREFRFFVSKRVITTVGTIGLALALRSYWALVLGSLLGRGVGVALSYLMHEYRPRWTLIRLPQLWSFSQWNILASIGSYLSMRTDQFIVGRRADASTLGAYSLGGEIAALPSTELVAPLGRVMFPAFALVKDQPVELLRLVLLAISVQALIGIPAGVGMSLVAPEVIPLLLGSQWYVAIPFAQLLALAGVCWSMTNSSNYLLLALGQIRTLAVYHLLMFGALLVTLVLVFPSLGAEGIATARLGIVVASVVVLTSLASRALQGFGLKQIMRMVWRPCVATIVMALVVMAIAESTDFPVLWALAAKIGCGAASYVAVLWALWRLAGRPDGGERYILGKL